MPDTDLILGVDPGLSGAFCFMHINPINSAVCDITFEKMPLLDRELDLKALRQIFSELRNVKHVFIEKVSAMPRQGVSSMFKFGRVVGALQAMAASFELPFTEVGPLVWQREMHQGISKINVNYPKTRSLMAVQRLFPRVNLLATEKSKKPHDGYVDALLIAEYGRRHLLS